MSVYTVYQVVGTVSYLLSIPFVWLFSHVSGNIRLGLGQRYGLHSQCPTRTGGKIRRIWIHAASVGEVQAARVLVQELASRRKECEFFLSTMTTQGNAVARAQLPHNVHCFLAPLDVPMNVRGFLKSIGPDLYICLETELWPAMFMELKKSGIPSLLLNGRMTSRSFRRYRRTGRLFTEILTGLSGVAVITREHADRFKALGARPDCIRVTGNMKYDFPDEDSRATRAHYRILLDAGDRTVFICGSTRTGEEKILAGVYRSLAHRCEQGVLWVVAPRHLERLEKVKQILAGEGLGFDLYSQLPESGRRSSVILVDTMGDLAGLYSAGDFNFVGGSLVDRGGHNIMEAARWGRPVYYGPGIVDFSDAAEMLEQEGGSFKVEDGDELASLLADHLRNRNEYEQACLGAARVVSLQRGAASRQADMVFDLLANVRKQEMSGVHESIDRS